MTDKQLTVRLYEMLKAAQPVTISAKLPTIDDARAIIAVDFQESGDDWKAKGAKNAVSRYQATFWEVLFPWFYCEIINYCSIRTGELSADVDFLAHFSCL